MFWYQIITHDNEVGLTVKHSVRQKNVLNSFHDFFNIIIAFMMTNICWKRKKNIIKYWT